MANDAALGADDVAEVEADQELERLGAEQILPRVELDLPGAVDEVDERRPPVAAPGGDPSRDPAPVLGLGAGGEPLVRGSNLGDLRASLERMRERLDPCFAQSLQLLPPLGEELGLGALAHSHAGEPIAGWLRRLRSW